MIEEEWNNWIDTYKSTAGHKKFLNYLNEIIKTEIFQDTIKKLRKKYKIPEKGYKYGSAELEKKEITDIDKEPVMYIDINKGEYYFSEEAKKIKKELKKLSEHFNFANELVDVFIYYLYYNEISDFSEGTYLHNMCIVSDLAQEEWDPFSIEYRENMRKLYPIAIRIRPEATKRDILDYINKMYKFEIKQLQQRYKEKSSKMGLVKKKNPIKQERDELIYQNRNLSKKEIAKLVSEEYKEYLDVGLIGKIISIQKKKRKEV